MSELIRYQIERTMYHKQLF